MKIVSMALAAAVMLSGLALGASPTLAAPASAAESAGVLQLIHDRGWDRGRGRHRGWDRPNRRHGGWNNRRGHRQWGHYRPQRRCHTEWVFEFGPYGARWAPIQRCYRGW
jgi:Ni/Co efflux regulator RcnB